MNYPNDDDIYYTAVIATEVYDYMHVRIGNPEDTLPESGTMRDAIDTVQKRRGVRLIELFIECHNKSQGFRYNERKLRSWYKCEKEVLEHAYGGKVPSSAYLTGY